MALKKIVATFILFMLPVFIGLPAHAAPVVWKGQTWCQEGSLYYQSVQNLAKHIKRKTRGRLAIEFYPIGTFSKKNEMAHAVKHNIIQVAINSPAAYAELEPAFAAIGVLPGSWTEVSQIMKWFYEGNGKELLGELYEEYDMIPIGAQSFGMESISSMKPIRRIEDFKGRRIRIPDEGMVKMFFEKMGAATLLFPESEISVALEKGFLDMVDWGTPAMNYHKGFYKSARHFNFPGFHSLGMTDFSVRKQDWKQLLEKDRIIVLDEVVKWGDELIRRVNEENYVSIGKMLENGAVLNTWSNVELYRAREKAVEVWNEWSKKSPMSRRVIESQKICLKELGLIKLSDLEMNPAMKIEKVASELFRAFNMHGEWMRKVNSPARKKRPGHHKETQTIHDLNQIFQKTIHLIQKMNDDMIREITDSLDSSGHGAKDKGTVQNQTKNQIKNPLKKKRNR